MQEMLASVIWTRGGGGAPHHRGLACSNTEFLTRPVRKKKKTRKRKEKKKERHSVKTTV